MHACMRSSSVAAVTVRMPAIYSPHAFAECNCCDIEYVTPRTRFSITTATKNRPRYAAKQHNRLVCTLACYCVHTHQGPRPAFKQINK
jgi:hypothetical protein